MLKRTFLQAIFALLSLSPLFAHADDWGCQVLLCLADPRGPETEAECVPPIEKLWSELAKGHGFPSCDMNSSLSSLPPALRELIGPVNSNTSASNTFASGSYCSPDLLYWGGQDNGTLMCRASGGVNVSIDGKLFTRVWWGTGGNPSTTTENYGQGSTQAPYDPTQTGQAFIQQQQDANYPGFQN